MERLPAWQRAIAGIALLKCMLGTAAIVAAATFFPAGIAPRDLLMLAHVAAFSAGAVILMLGGRQDHRAVALGVVLLLTASAFSDRLLIPFHYETSPPLVVLRGIFALQADSFSPLFLWLFVRDFPRASLLRAGSSVTGAAILASVAIGGSLFALNVLLFVTSLSNRFTDIHAALGIFARTGSSGLYWPAQFALSIPALPALVWKAKLAPVNERRRVALLVGALVAGTAPTLLRVFLMGVSATARRAFPLDEAGWVIYPTLLSTPFTTAYAVLVHRALDVRLVVRRAMQYALARQGVLALMCVPFVTLLVVLYGQRNRSVSQIAVSVDGAVLAGIAFLGVAALLRRRPLLEGIDRRFFREQYDARRILGQLVEQCGRATSADELAAIIRAETERALHPETASVLFLNANEDVFESSRGDVRPLDAASGLAERIGGRDDAIDIDLEAAGSFPAVLSQRDRGWLADANVRLILPLKDAERRLVGLLLLGEKRSELPYSMEDRSLLSSVAGAAALSLAYLSSQPRRGQDSLSLQTVPPPQELAAECGRCGSVQRGDSAACGRCGGATAPSGVPLILAGKFRFLQRVGAGSMGVVYRGLDLQLDRPVAIKTLPHVYMDQAIRLRREARAMAAIAHPNLALIYGSESWHGVPMLICEYLPGGTLTERLANGPFEPAAAVRLGIVLSDVARAIHRAGILHRDIKPSNIGYSSEGSPKLLDFGVARLIGRPPDAESSQGLDRLIARITGEFRSTTAYTLTATPEGQLVGTPLYMSPEAVQSEPPDASVDLWAICMVMYETIAGQHPLKESSLARTFRRIAECDIPDIREYLPSADTTLARFFHRAFASDASLRPADAEELGAELRSLRIA